MLKGYPKVGETYLIVGYSESFNGCRCKVISRDGEYILVKVLEGLRGGQLVELYPCELEELHW